MLSNLASTVSTHVHTRLSLQNLAAHGHASTALVHLQPLVLLAAFWLGCKRARHCTPCLLPLIQAKEWACKPCCCHTRGADMRPAVSWLQAAV